MTDHIILFAALFGFYPLMVLWIAATGPHNEFERQQRMRERWERHLD